MFEIKKHSSSNKTIRMPDELIEKLEKLAGKNDISFNQLVIQCCEYAIKHLKQDDDFNDENSLIYLKAKNLREDKDMNQLQMAKALNISQNKYSRYESGENNIPISVLISLAEFHKTNVDYILGLTENSTYYKDI